MTRKQMLVRAGLTFLGLAVASGALLTVEGLIAAKRTYLSPESAPPIEGHFGSAGPKLRMVMIGDSSAAGVGATITVGSAGGHLAKMLSETGYEVQLSSVAVSGSRVSDLSPQISRALMGSPDIAVILIGGNDATHFSKLGKLEREMHTDIQRLTDAGVQVVLGTCPDMRSGLNFMRPARDVIGWQGRRVARTERHALAGTGATAVNLQELTGAFFINDPHRYLSADRFHPNDEGYGLWADALFPAVALEATKANGARVS